MAAELNEAQSAKILRAAHAHALEADAEHGARACLAFVQAVGCLSARFQQEKAAFLSRLQSEDTLTKPDPEDSDVQGTPWCTVAAFPCFKFFTRTQQLFSRGQHPGKATEHKIRTAAVCEAAGDYMAQEDRARRREAAAQAYLADLVQESAVVRSAPFLQALLQEPAVPPGLQVSIL